MPITKVKSEFQKLSDILNNDVIADECTARELQAVHDQLQDAILSRDPAQRIREEEIAQQLIIFGEKHPVVGKAIKDLITGLSSMGI